MSVKKLMMMVAAAVAAMGVNAADVVKGGKPVAAVRVGENPTLAFAAQELTNWVAKITGAVLPLNAKGAAKTEIVIGTPETVKEIADFAKKHAAEFAKIGTTDGFMIAEEGARIYIAGNRPKGALNGTFRFLTENSDLVFARPLHADDGFGTVYGQTPDFANRLNGLVSVPSLPHHRYITSGGLWQVRLEGNEDFGTSGDAKRMEQALQAHMKWYDVQDIKVSAPFCIIDKYKETNPDLFPLLRGGKRDFGHDHQLCFMNPKAWDLYAKECEKLLAAAPAGYPLQLGLGLGDNWSVCTCKEWCMKPIKLPDGREVKPTDASFRSTQYAIMVNEIEKRLKGKFPQLRPISTGMYIFLCEPPEVLPASKSSGCYCPYVKNHKKPVFDDSVNEAWHQRAEEFYRRGMHFDSLYEYYLCTTTPKFYHATMEVMQQDLQYYHRHGLTGCYLDSSCEDFPGHEDNENWRFDISAIEFWTAMRLMWDVNANVADLRHDYCRRAYREAGEIMFAYYTKMAANYNSDSAGCYWNDDPILACKHYVVEKGLSDWVKETLAKAEAAAKHPSSKELVRRHRVRMESMIDKAAKLPKKVTYDVKQIVGKEPDMELDGAYWKDVAPLAPMTLISHPESPERGRTVIKLAHDNQNVYVLAYYENEFYHQKMVAAEKGPKAKPTDQFVWDTPAEIYFDGDYAAQGTYHFFSYMYNSVQLYTGKGPERDPKNPPWSVTSKSTTIGGKKGMISLLRFPMTTLGIDISKGNKCGFMFLAAGNYQWGAAWNGGQWHCPAGFQILRLEMK